MTCERDVALLSGPGLLGPDDIVFAPGPDVVYPDGDPIVRVSAGRDRRRAGGRQPDPATSTAC